MISPLSYIKIGVAVAITVTIGVLIYQNKCLRVERDTLQTSLTTALTANASQEEAIHQLQRQSEVASNRILKMMQDKQDIEDSNTKLVNRLRNLEKSNEIIKSYLNTLVPDDISRLLSGEGGDQDRDREGPSSQATSTSLRFTVRSSYQDKR